MFDLFILRPEDKPGVLASISLSRSPPGKETACAERNVAGNTHIFFAAAHSLRDTSATRAGSRVALCLLHPLCVKATPAFYVHKESDARVGEVQMPELFEARLRQCPSCGCGLSHKP